MAETLVKSGAGDGYRPSYCCPGLGPDGVDRVRWFGWVGRSDTLLGPEGTSPRSWGGFFWTSLDLSSNGTGRCVVVACGWGLAVV